MIDAVVRNRMLKTILLIIIFITLVSTLCACSNGNPQPENQESSQEHNDLPHPENNNGPPGHEENDNSKQEAPYEDGFSEEDGQIHVYLVGDEEKVFTPESSFIVYLKYYKESEHLIVCIKKEKGGIEYEKEYAYANISESLWEDFKMAKSKGEFYNAEIKGNTNFFIKDYDGDNGDLIVLEHIDN